MEPRISIITLGVGDLDRAVRFYAALGLRRYERITRGVAFFQMGGMILALWPLADLVADAGAGAAGTGFGGVALAYNTRSESEVDELLEMARMAGGRITRPAGPAFWGGRQGYFTDTEGHLWEVAHNPGFPLDAVGNIALPE